MRMNVPWESLGHFLESDVYYWSKLILEKLACRNIDKITYWWPTRRGGLEVSQVFPQRMEMEDRKGLVRRTCCFFKWSMEWWKGWRNYSCHTSHLIICCFTYPWLLPLAAEAQSRQGLTKLWLSKTGNSGMDINWVRWFSWGWLFGTHKILSEIWAPSQWWNSHWLGMEVTRLIRLNFGSSADHRTVCIELKGMLPLLEFLQNITNLMSCSISLCYQLAK